MKQVIFTIIMTSSLLHAAAQTPASPADTTVQRLYSEIKNARWVESRYLGCEGYQSPLWKKADTLKQLVGLKTFITYFKDASVNLKYYAFMEQLMLNDDSAFEMIKQTNHSDSVNFEYAGQWRDCAKLIELFTGTYLLVIKFRYYYTGGTWDTRIIYGAKNRKTWKRKQAIATKFIIDNNLSQKEVADFSH